MGLIPKSKVEQLKREKREAKAAKKRKVATRDKIVRFLIVCEGERTEPNYFKALVKDRYSEVRSEEIIGEGRSTCALVKKTEEIRIRLERQSQLAFDRVWVVFAKDDLIDFIEAIGLAVSNGFHEVVTTVSFGLWYVLHFVYLDAAISRADYIKILGAEIRKISGYEGFSYRKNDVGIYRLLQTIGNEHQAKLHAQRLRKVFEHSYDFKSHKPCTTGDLLVDELEHPDGLLGRKP